MKITAIVSSYNEEKTIRNVVHSISASNIFDEIIVVNDGSTDNTNEILGDLIKGYDLKYIVFKENMGKGYAMATDIENATGEAIVFIDADLSNLNDDHFSRLINPICKKEVDMVLGQPTDTLINYHINPFKTFTGQRAVLRNDILSIVEEMKKSKFGVETLINLYYQSQAKRVKYVKLKGLKHPTKFDKTNQSRAIREFMFEGLQIALIVFNNINLIFKIINNRFNNF